MNTWRDRIRDTEQPITVPVDTNDNSAEYQPPTQAAATTTWRDRIVDETVPPASSPAATADDRADTPALPSGAAHPTSNYLEQAVTGLKQGAEHALLPFAADKEFYKGEHTGVELTAQILSDLATGRAVAAGIGGAAGFLIPIPGGAPGGAMVGNTLYGLYAGIGEEFSRAKAEGQDFNPLRAAGNAALEINPLVKAATPLNAAIRAGLQALGTVGKEYSYTGDAKQAALTGAVSLVAAPFIYRGIRPDQVPLASTIQATQNMLASDVGLDLIVKAEDRLKAAGPAALKFSPTEDVTHEFAELYTGKSGDAALEEFKKLLPKLSPEQLDSAKEQLSRGQFFSEVAGEVAQQQADQLAKGAYEGVGSWGAKLKPARYVAAAIDRRLGTNVEGLVDDFSKAKDRFTNKAAGFLTEANRVSAAQRKLGVSNEEVGRSLAGQRLGSDVESKLDTVIGKTAFTDETGKQVQRDLTLRDSWRKLYDDVRGETRKSGVDVGYQDNYLPRTVLRGPDLAMAIKDQVSQLQAEAIRTGAKSLLTLKSDSAKEFRTLAAGLLRKSEEELTAGDLAGLAQSVLDPSKSRLGFSASSVFERTSDVLPEWVKEYDVGRNFTRYLTSNLKAAEFAQPFRTASGYVNGFRAMGLNNSAAWLESHLSDLAGASKPSIMGGMWNGLANKAGMLGRELEKEGSTKLGATVKAVPDFLTFLNTNVYPAYLGMNAKATLRNMTQAWMTTAPELGGLGGLWGQGLVTKAAFMTARDIATKGLGAIETNLQSRGLLGNFTSNETQIQRGFLSGAKGAAQKLNQAGMWAYEKSDVLNRAIAANTADLLHAEIQKGSPQALAVLERLPTGFKTRIRVGGGSADETRAAFADYLVGRTQFRYGAEQSFALGRDLGQSFTMFTTWPTMVLADVVDVFDRNIHKSGMLSGSMQAVKRVGEKYMVPLSLLAGIQHLVSEDPDRPQMPAGAGRYLLGKDLRELSPVLAFKQLDFAGGPAVSFSKDVVAATVAGEPSKARTVLRRGLKTYVPVASTILNELDRLQEGFSPGEATPSRELTNTVTGKEE